MHCSECHDRVGVYEPIWVLLADGSERRGSPLTLADELGSPGALVLHEGCHRQRADSHQR